MYKYLKMEKGKKLPRPALGQGGAAMLISVVFFLFISLAIITGLTLPTVREFKNSSINLNSKRSYFLAESGSEDAAYRILRGFPIGSTENITFGSDSVTTTITALADGTKQILSLADIYTYQRKINLILSSGVGVSFPYAVQVDQGGINLTGSGTVNGNVYSNGPITGDSSAIITGTAVSGGSSGIIAGSSGSQWNQLHIGTVSGTASAHTVNYTNATGNIYCQSGTGNNKSCISQADPSYAPLPISNAQITQWKNAATAGGTYNGNYSVGWAGATLGPKKIVGNLTVSGGGTLNVSGTLWVTGNITLDGGATVRLESSYGTNDGLIVADGNITITGGGHAAGSGTTGSYIMFLSTSSSGSAISVTGGAGAVIVYAANGTVNIDGGASLKEAVGYRVRILGGSTLTYEAGLANSNFSSGPSGSWELAGWREN